MENVIKTRVGNNGRFVIPNKIRRQLNIKDGDQVQVGIQDGKIVILTPEALLEEFYDLTKNLRESGVDVVQELIQERREEAKRE